jgi:tripeptidyl-peptidase-1
VNVTIHEAERLLKTEYKIYEDRETQKRALGCDEYSVPTELRRHIDFITPAIQAVSVTKTKRATSSSAGIRHIGDSHRMRFKNVTTQISSWKLPTAGLHARDSGISSLAWDISVCDSYVTRACIQALYHVPNGTLTL